MAKTLPFINRIREFREARAVTQAELARQIGMTRQTIISIEQGKYSPSLEAAFRIAHALDASLSDLFQWREGHRSQSDGGPDRLE